MNNLNLNLILRIQCFLFAILFGIWLQPETIFIRNSCLIIGAFLSLPVIYKNFTRIRGKNFLPIFLIVILLFYVVFHLFFLGHEFQTELKILTHSWKKIGISIIFAFGLGLGLKNEITNQKNNSKNWIIIYVGFCSPVVIFYLKHFITLFASLYHLEVSKFLIQSDSFLTDTFGIPRAGYVFFTLPALVISLNMLILNFRENKLFFNINFIYFIFAISTPLIYVIENDRFGQIFFIGIIGVTIIQLLKGWGTRNKNQLAGLILLSIVMLSLTYVSLKNNQGWQSFSSDMELAIHVDRYDAWKYTSTPKVSQGISVSESNYVRVAWFIVGSRLSIAYPWGYGLMSNSFGGICKLIWPDSNTSWTHSAWLDFTLGYGFLGLVLFLGAALLALINNFDTPRPWRSIGVNVITIWTLLFCVKELSAEIYVNAFIFIIVLAAGISMRVTRD